MTMNIANLPFSERPTVVDTPYDQEVEPSPAVIVETSTVEPGKDRAKQADRTNPILGLGIAVGVVAGLGFSALAMGALSFFMLAVRVLWG